MIYLIYIKMAESKLNKQKNCNVREALLPVKG